MYVTRNLSYYRKFPEALATQPEGPNSGYLIIQDEESETYNCFGLCKNPYLEELPFPQNKDLAVRHSSSSGQNSTINSVFYDVVLIPVVNQPLSSNLYYAIQPHGKHKGEAFTCSREEDKMTCCFCRCVKDVNPRPLDPNNVYQQVKIEAYESSCSSRGQFYGKSIAPDGFAPEFFRRKGWEMQAKTSKKYQLREAAGLNASLREVLPDFDAIVVGKWCIPFVFIKEGALRDQMKRSRFYEMTLERKWEQIFACQNDSGGAKSVSVDVAVETKVVCDASGKKVVWDDNINVDDGVVWFRNLGNRGGESSVGLRVEVVERMKWEQESGGWHRGGGGEENQVVRVKRVEEFGGVGGGGGWREFGSYVLVESFVLRRMDGSLVMSFDFRHTHQIKSKWE